MWSQTQPETAAAVAAVAYEFPSFSPKAGKKHLGGLGIEEESAHHCHCPWMSQAPCRAGLALELLPPSLLPGAAGGNGSHGQGWGEGKKKAEHEGERSSRILTWLGHFMKSPTPVPLVVSTERGVHPCQCTRSWSTPAFEQWPEFLVCCASTSWWVHKPITTLSPLRFTLWPLRFYSPRMQKSGTNVNIKKMLILQT